MTQSNAIFAALALAFIVFITVRGELRTYMGFLFGGSPGLGSQPNAAPGTSAAVDKAVSLATMAAKLAALY